MKNLLTLAVLMVFFGSGPFAQAEDVLTGDKRLACEALLCLSSGTRPGECSSSLSRYFGIKKRWWSDTVKARFNFLELCPTADESAGMRSLTKAISRGAGRCDAAGLNMLLKVIDRDDDYYYISNKMPSYCAAYNNHEYTDLPAPIYIGEPKYGGFWTEPGNYKTALAKYKEIKKKRQGAWH